MHICDVEKSKRKLQFTTRRLLLIMLGFALIFVYFGQSATVAYRNAKLIRDLDERGFTVAVVESCPPGPRGLLFKMGFRSMFRQIRGVKSMGQPIDVELAKALVACDRLQVIECEDAGLTDQQLSELLKSQSLLYLKVRNNPLVTDEVIEVAIRHPSLMEIRLDGTSISNVAYQRYLEARTNYHEREIRFILERRTRQSYGALVSP